MVETNQEDARSLGEMISGLTRQISFLVREEISLAKTELREKLTQAQSGIMAVAAGGVFAFAGLLMLLQAAALLLDELIEELWLSSLVVAVLVVTVGLALMLLGRSRLKAGNLTLEKTPQSLREDKEMVQARLRRKETA